MSFYSLNMNLSLCPPISFFVFFGSFSGGEEDSWILRTTATCPCRRPRPTSMPAIRGLQKPRMMGKCPVTPFGCGSPCWQPLATSWWWLQSAPAPSDTTAKTSGSKHENLAHHKIVKRLTFEVRQNNSILKCKEMCMLFLPFFHSYA